MHIEHPGVSGAPYENACVHMRDHRTGGDEADHNRHVGAEGETLAASWYEANGFEVLDRNWRCRAGELDLICLRGTTVAFVEVKARSSGRHGGGVGAVGWKKRQRIRALATTWLQQRNEYFEEIRFDVVDVDRAGHLRVFEACF